MAEDVDALGDGFAQRHVGLEHLADRGDEVGGKALYQGRRHAGPVAEVVIEDRAADAGASAISAIDASAPCLRMATTQASRSWSRRFSGSTRGPVRTSHSALWRGFTHGSTVAARLRKVVKGRQMPNWYVPDRVFLWRVPEAAVSRLAVVQALSNVHALTNKPTLCNFLCMATDEEILGRDDANDLEAILDHEPRHGRHHPRGQGQRRRHLHVGLREGRAPAAVNKLYEKAKTSQWNGETDLDWSIEVDQREGRGSADVDPTPTPACSSPWASTSTGSPLAKWGDKEWTQLDDREQNWTLSQFMHGEQGALLCTAKIVETVPWIDAKYYAATQVMDEARHVEVFAKYLDTKLTGHYPINAHLRMLLDDIINDSRWDMTYLGMQIMVEGLALAAFGFVHSDHRGAAAQAAAALRDERRGPPRRVRRAVAARSTTTG